MASDESERVSGDVGLRLTYAEIASRLRISGDAARQLVRRRGWLRIVPNRRGATTIVIVPDSELAGERWRGTRSADEGVTTPDGDRSELRTALSLVDRLSVQLADANTRTDAAMRRADAAEDRATQAEEDRRTAEARAERAESEAGEARAVLDRARAAAQEARGTVAALQTTIDALKAGQATMQDMHAHELEQARAEAHKVAEGHIASLEADAAAKDARIAQTEADLEVARRDAQQAQQTAAQFRLADTTRKGRGRWARLRAAWRGE